MLFCYADKAECSEAEFGCAVCEKPAVGTAHKCSECHSFVHIFCGNYDESTEGFGSTNICFNCTDKKKSVKSKKPASKVSLQPFGARLLLFYLFLLLQ